jgi:hypothetical protein
MSPALMEPLPCNKATRNNLKSIERAPMNLTQPEFVLFLSTNNLRADGEDYAAENSKSS